MKFNATLIAAVGLSSTVFASEADSESSQIFKRAIGGGAPGAGAPVGGQPPIPLAPGNTIITTIINGTPVTLTVPETIGAGAAAATTPAAGAAAATTPAAGAAATTPAAGAAAATTPAAGAAAATTPAAGAAATTTPAAGAATTPAAGAATTPAAGAAAATTPAAGAATTPAAGAATTPAAGAATTPAAGAATTPAAGAATTPAAGAATTPAAGAVTTTPAAPAPGTDNVVLNTIAGTPVANPLGRPDPSTGLTPLPLLPVTTLQADTVATIANAETTYTTARGQTSMWVTVISNGKTVGIQTTYAQRFSSFFSDVAAPSSGGVGLGTLSGTVGAVKPAQEVTISNEAGVLGHGKLLGAAAAVMLLL